MTEFIIIASIIITAFVIVGLVPTWSFLVEYLWEKQEEFIEKLKNRKEK